MSLEGAGRVKRLARSHRVDNLHVLSDDRGDALVAYTEQINRGRPPRTVTTSQARVAIRRAGGVFGAPQVVLRDSSRDKRAFYDLSAACDEAGRITLVIPEYLNYGLRGDLLAIFGRIGHGFSAPVKTGGSAWLGRPGPAVSAGGGRVAIGWPSYANGENTANLVTGDWGRLRSPVVLAHAKGTRYGSPYGAPAVQPLVTADGGVTVVFTRHDQDRPTGPRPPGPPTPGTYTGSLLAADGR